MFAAPVPDGRCRELFLIHKYAQAMKGPNTANFYSDVNSMGQTIAPKKGFFSLGISIYANDNETWEDFGDNYKATDFDKATGWSAFLDQNTVGVFKSAINPANNSVWNLDYLDE